MPKLRDTMREVAAQWRQLAADVEARRKNPEVNSQRGRAPQIRDTPQRPGSPPANFVLLVGLQNRQIARGERQKIPCRLDLGAELTDEFWSEIGRKPRVFDMTVERERDREIPKAVRSLDQAAPQADIAGGPLLGAPDDAFDQTARIVVRHIDRQGVAPAGPVQVEPRDGVKACAVRGRRQVLLDPMQLADKFGGHRNQVASERGWDAPGFLGGGLIRIDAARDEIKSALKPLVQPPTALNGPQRQAALAD